MLLFQTIRDHAKVWIICMNPFVKGIGPNERIETQYFVWGFPLCLTNFGCEAWRNFSFRNCLSTLKPKMLGFWFYWLNPIRKGGRLPPPFWKLMPYTRLWSTFIADTYWLFLNISGGRGGLVLIGLKLQLHFIESICKELVWQAWIYFALCLDQDCPLETENYSFIFR